MAWLICSRAPSLMTRMVGLRPFAVNGESFQCSPLSGIAYPSLGLLRNYWPSSSTKLAELNNSRLGSSTSSSRDNPVFRWDASASCHGQAQEATSFKVEDTPEIPDGGLDLFDAMKQRFLRFKKRGFLEEAERFQALSRMQSPKTLEFAPLTSSGFNLEKLLWSETWQTLSLHFRMDHRKQMLLLNLL